MLYNDIGGSESGVEYPWNYSFARIINVAKLSGLLGPDPLLRDTSDLRDFSDGFSYHFTGNAVDFGDDAEQGSDQQTRFAQWVAEHFGPFSLEIIHTVSPGVVGVYWKNGQPVDGETFYGSDTVEAHRNHVHWAITNQGLNAAGMPVSKEADPMANMPTLNLNNPINGNAPVVRNLRYLLAARGIWYDPKLADHASIQAAYDAFCRLTHLPVNGIVDSVAWSRLGLPLNLNGVLY